MAGSGLGMSGMAAVGSCCTGEPFRAWFIAMRQIGPGPVAPNTSGKVVGPILMFFIGTPPAGPPSQTEVASCGV